MEKKDLVFLAIAVGVVMIVALVAKPALTGEGSPGLALPFVSTPAPTASLHAVTSTSPPRPVSMVIFANLSGNRSGTTESVEIPFPYWEIVYTAEAAINESTNGTLIFPRLKIQVMDAESPSRIMRNLEPDLLDARINTSHDPRPWIEQIGEGYHRYYFVVHIQEVRSYHIEIRVPQEQ
ncbi:MAG: hypothetical protein LUO93_07865 [Methanomicrobiales archaeon]|nr:hypothetical protein [Methanomicrobiales archaeon]